MTPWAEDLGGDAGTALRQERDAARKELEQVRSARDMAVGNASALGSKLDTANRKLGEASVEIERLRAKVKELEQEIEDCREQCFGTGPMPRVEP